MNLGTLREEGLTKLSGGEFEGYFLLRRELGSPCPSRFQFTSHRLGLSANENQILPRGSTPQGVVEMANDEALESEPDKNVEKDHRVTASRDTDEQFFIMRKARHRAGDGGWEQFRSCRLISRFCRHRSKVGALPGFGLCHQAAGSFPRAPHKAGPERFQSRSACGNSDSCHRRP